MKFIDKILNREVIMQDLPVIASKIYPKEVLEIHNEFEIAADKLLLNCNNILEEATKKDVNKISRLESLGFRQSKQVTELKPLLEQAKLSKEQIELVNYYKRQYPFNKFITEEQVKTICHKYNLVCGDVDKFKGFVPEKNLKEVENFKLKEKDIIKYTYKLNDNTPIDLENDLTEYGKRYLLGSNNAIERAYITGSDPGVGIYSTPMFTENCIGKFFNKRFIELVVDNNAPKLKICAPVKEMDISGLELVKGYKLEKKHIPDPVVLQPVKGGYLVITKWGDEASDPILLNEIDN